MAAPRGNRNNANPRNKKPDPPKGKATARPGQGISRAAANKFVSPNIGGEQPTGDVFGAYDSGTSMDRTRRNEYLNTLDVETRARVMNKMGYWTGGVRVRPSAQRADEYKKFLMGQIKSGELTLNDGEIYQPEENGTFIGTLKNVGGKYVWTALGRGKGISGKGKGKGGGNGGGSGGVGGGGASGGGPGGYGDPGDIGVSPGAGSPGQAFTTGVSGATGEFVTEAGVAGPAGDEAETNTTKTKTKKKRKAQRARRNKLVKRAVKKTPVKGKAVRRALRSEGVTKSDKKVYARVAKTAPKLSDRLRRVDRRGKK